MTSEHTLLENIQALKAEILSNLAKTRGDTIIDISKLPDQLLQLHNRIQTADEVDHPALNNALQEVLLALDELSTEIQHRYTDISEQLAVFEPEADETKE